MNLGQPLDLPPLGGGGGSVKIDVTHTQTFATDNYTHRQMLV